MKKFDSSKNDWTAVGEIVPTDGKLKALWMMLLLMFFGISSSLQAQCPMGCSNMNLSLDTMDGGAVQVTPAMVLTNPNDAACLSATLSVVLKDQYGRTVSGDMVTCDYVGQQLTVSVVEAETGNSCWAYVNVEDKVGPNLGCIVDTIYCVELEKYELGLDRFPSGMASDNCGLNEQFPVVVSMKCEEFTCEEDAEFAGICVRRVFAKDKWGTSAECYDTFYVRRIPLDSIVCPPDTLFECFEADSLDMDGDGHIDYEKAGTPLVYIPELDSFIQILPGGPVCNTFANYKDHEWPICGEKGRKIRRTWEIVDWCRDTTITCVQYIKVVDTLAPEFEPYDDIETGVGPHDCKGKVLIPYPTITKECSGVEKVLVEVSYFEAKNHQMHTQYETLSLTQSTYITPPAGVWDAYVYITDSCGNMALDTFTITVIDNTPPTPICDEITRTTLDPNECWARIYATTFDDGSYDNCCPKLHFSAAHMDSVEYYRELWKDLLIGHYGLDVYAANAAEFEAWIEIWIDCNVFNDYVEFGECSEDNMVIMRVYSKCHLTKYYDPHLHGDSEHFFYCIETYGDLGKESTALNGIDTGYFDGDFIDDLAGLERSPRHYNECMVTVNVDDKVPPVCVPHDDVTVYCDGVSQDPDGPSALYAECSTTKLHGSGTLLGHGGPTAEGYANCVECPYWLEFDSLDVRIDPTGYFRTPDVLQSCGDVIMDSTTVGNIDDCGEGVITRTWTIVDPCGNSSTCSQNVYVLHRSDFKVKFPADTTLFCDADLTNDLDPENIGLPFVTDDECEQIGISYEDETFTIVEDACLKILRKWTIIDWCVYDPDQYERYQDICVLNDSIEPCIAGPDRENILRYLKDNGDGHMVYTQVIKVRNLEAPEIDPRGTSVTITCADDANTCEGGADITVAAIDDCTPEDQLRWIISLDANSEGNFVVLSRQTGGSATINENFPVGQHLIRFQVEDNCGNVTDTTINMDIDLCKKPTPYCHDDLVITLMGVDTTDDGVFDLGMVEIWAEDFDAGSFAYCDQDIAAFSFSSDTTDKYRVMTCDSLGEVTLQMWVTDTWGNQDFCEVTVTVQDNMGACTGGVPQTAMIEGKIITERNENVEKVDVSLRGSGAPAVSTESEGTYTFGAMNMGGNYSIIPKKDINPTNGVSTLDLVLIQKHILGIEKLTSPYRIIAGDIDRSSAISALDVVHLRKLILGIDQSFTNNTSWRFVSKDYEFVNPENPLNEPFVEEYSISNLTENMNVEFIGVKVGDVNGTVTPSELQGAEIRSNKSLDLAIANAVFNAGQIVDVPVTASNFVNLVGYQFSLGFDQDQLSYVGVTPGLLDVTDQNMGVIVDGQLTTSWSSVDGMSASSDDVLFTLHFDAKAAGQLANNLYVHSKVTKAESYDELLNIQGVRLTIESGTEESVDQGYALYQNTPNPFTENTLIAFTLPQAAKATLKVMDVTGKVLKQYEANYAAGLNQIEISKADIQAAGVLYYQLETQGYTATKKMIIVE